MEQKLYQWLIRIDKIENITKFLTGNIRFSIPKCWRKFGDGMYDVTEGVLAIEPFSDSISYIPGESRNVKDICYFTYEGKNYVLDSKIDFVPTLCFYSFEYDTDIIELPKKYFDDFAKNKNEYGFIVIEANKFDERLREAITKFGLKKDDLFFHSIKYIEKNNDFSTLDKYPFELLYKDNHYSYQNEVRFFITSTDNVSLEKLKLNGYYVDIDLQDLIKGIHPIPEDDEYASFKKEGESYLLKIEKKII